MSTRKMEKLREEITLCIRRAQDAYSNMLSRSKFDTRALQRFFEPFRKYEADLPRLFAKQDGPLPVLVVNICYFPAGTWSSSSSRVVGLQISGGFFPNQERPLFSITEISLPRPSPPEEDLRTSRVHLKPVTEGKRLRPVETRSEQDQITPMKMSGWIESSGEQSEYVYSASAARRKPERLLDAVPFR